ncbi:MAG: hypothetical protein MK207_12920 [Saprospiraceae bacterium]|nr:hypothetical protein [Saprospiraceae bacterium]
MAYKIYLFLFAFFVLELSYGQELIWVHQPFSVENLPVFRYSQDTVVFQTNSAIWGLINLPNTDEANPQITINIRNLFGEEKSADFYLTSIKPDRLNWHNQIKKWYSKILESPNWYFFEITPNPSVVNAAAGVDFLSVINHAAFSDSLLNRSSFLSYKINGDSSYNACTIDFRYEQGFFQPLWTKLHFYQQLQKKKKQLETDSVNLVQTCSDYGIQQITQWAKQSAVLKKDLIKSDLNIFQEVENLKIITETIPDSISKDLKRKLRGMLTLDVAILHMTDEKDKELKICQKKDMLKELSLYPELQDILANYIKQNQKTTLSKEFENGQNYKLKSITEIYAPFEPSYLDYREVQKALKIINKQLLKFD